MIFRSFGSYSILALVVVGFLAVSAYSQTGTIQGSVTDTNHQPLPAAAVRLVSQGTGLERTAVADRDGIFRFTLVEPAGYYLEANASGFKAARLLGVRAELGQTTEYKLILTPGDINEAISVNAAETVQLDNASSSLGGSIERRRIENLPLNGRNIFQLAQLEPGAVASPSARGTNPDLTATGEVSINGGRALTNEYLVDGVSITNKGDNRISLKPSVDSIQEFRIQTNSYSAEYGRSGGGALTLLTRAGTSEYHLAGWEYFRNDFFDATSYFVNANPALHKEKLRYNQFGVNGGGPLPVWKDGRLSRSNKLFFFANYEGQRISQSLLSKSTVPTAKMRSGDFSELLGAPISGVTVVDTSGNLIPARIGQIYVPGVVVAAGLPGAGSRVAFANNVIPAATINAVSRAALAYYPLPNASPVFNASGLGYSNNYIANAALATDARQLVTRIDYNISSTQQIYGRLIRDWNALSNSGPFPASVASPIANPIQNNTPGSVMLNYQYSVSSRAILRINGGATRFNNNASSFSSGFDPTSLGLPAYLAGASSDARIFPTLNLTGYTSLGPPRNFGFFHNNQDSFSLNEDVSVLVGKHSVKFGASQRLYRAYNYRPDDPAGNFTFNRSFTSRTPGETAQQTGDSFASFLLGNPASGRLAIAPQIAVQSKYLAFFLQDDFSLNQRLTLNLGLRWEADLPNTERYDRLTNFDPAAQFPVNQLTVNFPASTGLGTRVIPLKGVVTPVGRGGVSNRENFNRDLNNFGPRIGFAYKINDSTVIRGGGGFFFAPLSGGGFNTVTYAIADLAETPYVATLDNGATPVSGAGLSNPFPSGIVQQLNAYGGPATSYGQQSIPVRLRGTRQPYTVQWNLNVQRELPGSLIVQVGYAGSAGVGLLGGATDLNQLSPESLAIARQLSGNTPTGNLTVANPFLNLPLDQRPPANSILGKATVTVAQLLRPYPQFGNIVSYGQNLSHSSYHSGQVKVSRRFVGGFTFTGAYTYSKSIDDLTSNSLNLSFSVLNYQDYNNLRADKGLSNFDITHRGVGSFTWELPFGKGRRYLKSGIGAKLFGGISLSGITQAQSGLPISVSATNASLQGLGFIALRPNLVGDPAAAGGTDRLTQYFNTAAFQQPAQYTFGSAPRTLSGLRSPGFATSSVSVAREIRIREGLQVQLRAEGFNVFNRANFGAPGSVLGASGFGVISSTEDPRLLQFAARVSW